MTVFPDQLRPTGIEQITLLSGRTISLPKASCVFEVWTGPVPKSSYGHKAVLDWRDEPVFAELAILRIFKSENWDGRWIDSYGRKYRVGYWKDDTVVPLPEAQDKYLDRIRNAAGQKGGCFDVFCWRDGDVVFAEAKRKGKDRIRDSQRRWVEAALHLGVAADQLLIVEWIIA